MVSKSESPINKGKLVTRPTNIFKHININYIIYLREETQFQLNLPHKLRHKWNCCLFKGIFLEINLNAGVTRQALSYNCTNEG